MATNEERLAASAQWLRANADKKGTPDFERVAQMYKTLRTSPQPQPAPDGQQAAQPQEEQTTLAGLAGNFGGGAVDSLLTLPGAPADLVLMGIDKLGQQFGAKPLTPEMYANNPLGTNTVRSMFKDYVSPDMFGPEAKTKAEQYARRIGEFVGPAAALSPVSMLKPAITAGVTGGVGSQAAQDAFPDNPWAPVVGGLLGGFAPGAAKLAGSARVPTAGMNGESAKLAQGLIDEGIPVFPGQVGSKASKIAYDAVSKLPFMGRAARDQQLQAFNSAVARTFGEDATHITPEVMSRAKARIGNDFNEVFARNNINADSQLLNDLGDIQLRATTNLTDAQANDVGKAISSILNEASKDGGVLSGRKYHAFTSKGGALQNLTSNADPNIKHYAGQVREAIDDAFTRHASEEDVARLLKAKQQYRAMKVVQDLVPKAQGGNISPALLLGRVMQNDKQMAYTGGGKLGMLARGGQEFLKEIPGSQTPERQMLYGALGTIGGGAAYMSPQVIAPAAAVWAGSRGIKALLESKKLGARMVAGALRRANGHAAKFDAKAALKTGARASIPGAAGVAGRGKGLEVTLDRGDARNQVDVRTGQVSTNPYFRK